MSQDRKNFVWNMIGVILNAIYSVILIVIITRTFKNGIELSGRFSYAFNICALLFTIGSYGGRIYQITDNSNKYKNEDYISSKILSSIIMFIIAILFCFINKYELDKLLLIMSLILFRMSESISEAFYGIVQKEDKLEYVGKSMTIRTLLASTLFVIAIVVTENLFLSSLSFFIIFLLNLLFYDMRKSTNYNISSIKISSITINLLKASFSVFATTFLLLLIMNITRYFVDYRLSDEIQGYFSILVLPVSFVNLLSQLLLQPEIMKLTEFNKNNENKNFNKTALKILAELIIFGLAAALIIYFIGPYVYSLVFNLDFSKYRVMLSLGIISGICMGIITIFSNLLIIKRKLNLQLYLFIAISVFAIILSYLFVKNIYSSIYIYSIILALGSLLFFMAFILVCRRKENAKRS